MYFFRYFKYFDEFIINEFIINYLWNVIIV